MSADPARQAPVLLRSAGPSPRLLERRGGVLLVVTALTVGAFLLPGLGWLVGVVLLWTSYGWRRTDKIVGTLVGPVSLALPFAARSLLPGDIVDSPSTDCRAGGFCAPQFSIPWYANASTIGEFLAVVHLMLAVYLLLRFRPGTTARTSASAAQQESDR